MAFLWDLVARGMGAHPPAPVRPPPSPAPPAAEALALPVNLTIDGLVGLEKIAFAARQALAARWLGLRTDGPLTRAVLEEAAATIPEGAALDEAAQVAAVLIPFLVDLRRGQLEAGA